jgi:hypothetical protein
VSDGRTKHVTVRLTPREYEVLRALRFLEEHRGLGVTATQIVAHGLHVAERARPEITALVDNQANYSQHKARLRTGNVIDLADRRAR